ncbi:MAG: hypothetical protein ACLPT4_04065, partial [Verrucomicrobiia bacterium]
RGGAHVKFRRPKDIYVPRTEERRGHDCRIRFTNKRGGKYISLNVNAWHYRHTSDAEIPLSRLSGA